MNIPDIVTLLPKWKLYAAIIGAALLLAGAIYLKGHSDGVDQTDNKWKAAIADSKPVEVKRDTVFIVQKPDSGTFTSQAVSNSKYQQKVNALIEASRVIERATSENDSLRQVAANLERITRSALEPKLLTVKSATIGELLLWYFPADSSLNVYKHLPPPERVVTVYQEKLILEPRSTWETVGYIALGTGIGILAAVITHIK